MNSISNFSNTTKNLYDNLLNSNVEKSIDFLAVDFERFQSLEKHVKEVSPKIIQQLRERTQELEGIKNNFPDLDIQKISSIKFLVDDNKELGYGITYADENTRLYSIIRDKGIRDNDIEQQFLTFVLLFDRFDRNNPHIVNGLLVLYEPYNSVWNIDIDTFSKRIITLNREHKNEQPYIKDWDDCVFDCVRDSIFQSMSCLVNQDCLLVSTGQAFAKCMWRRCW